MCVTLQKGETMDYTISDVVLGEIMKNLNRQSFEAQQEANAVNSLLIGVQNSITPISDDDKQETVSSPADPK